MVDTNSNFTILLNILTSKLYIFYAIVLKKPPVQGEMVIAKFQADDNFYRAIVKEINGDKFLLVYVDFGNEEVTDISRLYEMPNTLKAVG